jgi:hypothetical protein
MEILEGRVLSKYLLDKYAKEPRDWGFTMFPSTNANRGFYGGLVSSKDEVWQLGIDSIFKPNPIMVGTKVDVDPVKAQKFGNVSYGYRKLSPETLVKLLDMLNKQDDEGRTRPRLDSILRSMEPVAPKNGESYAEGPFVFAARNAINFSESQKQLEDRLSSQLRNLLRSKYMSYG